MTTQTRAITLITTRSPMEIHHDGCQHCSRAGGERMEQLIASSVHEVAAEWFADFIPFDDDGAARSADDFLGEFRVFPCVGWTS